MASVFHTLAYSGLVLLVFYKETGIEVQSKK